MVGGHFRQPAQYQRRGLLGRSKEALDHGDIDIGVSPLLQGRIDRHHGADVIGGAGVIGVIFRHEKSLLLISDEPDFQPLAGNRVGNRQALAVRLFGQHLGADVLQSAHRHGIRQPRPMNDRVKDGGGQTGKLLLQPVKDLFIVILPL